MVIALNILRHSMDRKAGDKEVNLYSGKVLFVYKPGRDIQSIGQKKILAGGKAVQGSVYCQMD
jgi:hypothetical protein